MSQVLMLFVKTRTERSVEGLEVEIWTHPLGPSPTVSDKRGAGGLTPPIVENFVFLLVKIEKVFASTKKF